MVALDRLRAALDTVADVMIAARSWGLGLAATEPTAHRDLVDAAVARGLRFLEHAQRADGSFRDFNLLPGASKDWITAHVAFVLENVPAADRIRSHAASFLASRGRVDGGWSYNDRVGVDCDSTAQAILVLRRANLDVPAFVVDWLVGCQLDDGSFPTYRADAASCRGWSAGHGDVTLIVWEALRRMAVGGDAIRRANAWLDRISVDGVVPAYWWSHDAYSLWAQERAGFATDASRRIAKVRLRDAPLTFSSMLLAAAAKTLDRDEVAAPVCRLLATQLEDGSWPCDPCLRVTNPAVTHVRDAAGPVYAGRRRVFSTAHATAALAAVSHLL